MDGHIGATLQIRLNDCARRIRVGLPIGVAKRGLLPNYAGQCLAANLLQHYIYCRYISVAGVLGVYFTFVMIMCCVELAFTMLVMNLYNRASSEPVTALPPPVFIIYVTRLRLCAFYGE